MINTDRARSASPAGLGAADSRIRFYIANRPPLMPYRRMEELRGLGAGEIAHIARETGNHWRKIFNVYAKLLFDWQALQPADQREGMPASWQDYRDHRLFQGHAREALLFTPPDFCTDDGALHIVAGKTYAATLALPGLTWLDNAFAIDENCRVIVSPYPDYRQLSNARIARLIELMTMLR